MEYDYWLIGFWLMDGWAVLFLSLPLFLVLSFPLSTLPPDNRSLYHLTTYTPKRPATTTQPTHQPGQGT
jgi:hypothetical protein